MDLGDLLNNNETKEVVEAVKEYNKSKKEVYQDKTKAEAKILD